VCPFGVVSIWGWCPSGGVSIWERATKYLTPPQQFCVRISFLKNFFQLFFYFCHEFFYLSIRFFTFLPCVFLLFNQFVDVVPCVFFFLLFHSSFFHFYHMFLLFNQLVRILALSDDFWWGRISFYPILCWFGYKSVILAEGAIALPVTLSGGVLFASWKLLQFPSSLIVKVILAIFMGALAQQ